MANILNSQFESVMVVEDGIMPMVDLLTPSVMQGITVSESSVMEVPRHGGCTRGLEESQHMFYP